MENGTFTERMASSAYRFFREMESNGGFFTDGFIIFYLMLIMLSFMIFITVRHQRRLRKAAWALGDDFYVTGIPNTVWKKYAHSFSEYQRLLHALADSGNFSPLNVRLFVLSFQGASSEGDVSQEDVSQSEIEIPKHDRIGTLGYQQTGHDQGYIHYSNFHKNE